MTPKAPAEHNGSAPWYMEPFGPLEAVANMGVNTAATVAGGLGALADAPLYASGISKTPPADVVHAAENFAAKPIFQPHTETGKLTEEALSYPFRKLKEGAEATGRYVLDKTGSPALAAGVDTAIQGAPMALGIGLKESPLAKGTDASRKAATEKTARNLTKDEAIRAAKRAGYGLHPAEVSSGLWSRALQMFAGEAKLGRQISHKNIELPDIAARADLGIAQDMPLTVDTLRDYRTIQSAAFGPAGKIGPLAADSTYMSQLHSLASEYVDAAKSFPEKDSPITEMVQTLAQPVMDSKAVISKTRMLRREASDSFRKGDSSLASAQRKAADALDDLLVRAAARRGMNPDLVRHMQAARANIAKSYAVEKALKNGHVDPRALARQWKEGRGAPLTGKLLDIAKIGAAFPKSVQMTEAPPFGVMESVFGTGLWPIAHFGMGMGEPASVALASIGMARPLTRFLMSSKPYQRMAIKPGRYPSTAINPSLAKFLATYPTAATASAQQ